MRLRVGAVLCLFLVFLGAGCRKALSPNVDTNVAPETWITAAPQDTITTRSTSGPPVGGKPGSIPVRYHMYWAGSDVDGTVVGFYWAVVETLPVPAAEGLGLPTLPGPKPQDYRFTTKTDSIFIFDASEDVSDREHTFYIYAIDNKGKPDPTPARFMFRAYDRFPPIAVIDSAYGEGLIYRHLPGGGVAPQVGTYAIRDSFHLSPPFPADTIPSGSRIEFRWHGEPTIPSTVVTGYRYKLDEPEFNVVDSTVKRATYNTGIGTDIVSPGVKKFTLRAVGQSGWRGEATRYFQMNFAPDSWFDGPDVSNPLEGWSTYQDGNGKSYYYRNVRPTGWAAFSIPGTMLSSDSVNVLPADRPAHRTFYEIYGDSIWAHSEGDTVSLNSWVLFPAGGYDPDSPYLVKVGIDPNRPVGVVTTPDPEPNGSPIGFRANATIRRNDGSTLRPTETSTYPVFDLTSSFHQPFITFKAAMIATGKAYAYVVAEDGDGTVDRRLQQNGGHEAVVEDVANGTATPEQIALRPQVMVFYVNHAPVVDTSKATFIPRPRTVIHGVNQTFNLLCHDIDNIDEAKLADRGGPQPNTAPVLVKTVTLMQQQPDTLLTQVVCKDFEGLNPNFTPLSGFVNGPMTVRVQLWDGRATLSTKYGRRGVTVDIPVTYSVAAPGGSVPAGGAGDSQSTQRPGSPQAGNGRP